MINLRKTILLAAAGIFGGIASLEAYTGVEVLDARHIMLISNKQPDRTRIKNIEFYQLTDQQGRPIKLQRTGYRSWVDAFKNKKPVVRHYIYLELADDRFLQPLQKYTCTFNNGLLRTKFQSITFSYNDETQISSSIKINQVGYLPQSVKYAYIGNYLGDAGEMPVSASVAYLKTADGKTVAELPLVRQRQNDLFHASKKELKPFCGEEVWLASFSRHTEPGEYYIQVPGMGRSYTFRIADDVYNTAYYHTARAFYYQRSGCEIEPQYAGKWHRPASHTAPSRYHNSVKDKSGALYDPAVEPPIGGTIDVAGGWYDAGDYNKYTQSAAAAANYILSIYELAPEKFTCDALNIPESGNGVPDILDQVKWELDWLARMVSASGGVFNKCSFAEWAQTLPQNRTEQMWVITKTTRDTAMACAVLAKASRIFSENGWYPEAAAAYSNKAVLAWQCLQQNPETYPLPRKGEPFKAYENPDGRIVNGQELPNIRTGPYYKNASDADDTEDRIWAALEIHNLTGDSTALSTFSNLVDSVSSSSFADDLERLVVVDWYAPPCNVFKLYPARDLNPTCSDAIADGIKRVVKVYRKGFDNWRYRISMKNTVTSVNFGGFSMSTRYSVYYILFYELTGDPKLLELAKENLNVQLGANPLSTTFITGIGDKSPLHPHCKIAEYDDIDEPIPGFSVYGCAHNLIRKGFYTMIMDHTYPAYQGSDPSISYYPSARKYVDAYEPVKMGEYVIDNMARTTMALGYFSDPSSSYAP